MNKRVIHVSAGGGIGDFIYSYFKRTHWKLVRPVKEKFPNITMVGVIACHASAAKELIEVNPHIDAILQYEWRPPGHPKEKLWQEILSSTDIKQFAKEQNIQPIDNTIYLSKKESNVFNDLSKDDYIVIHPFAGMPHRGCFRHPKDNNYKCFPDYSYIEVAKILRDKGYKVIIIGRSEHAMHGIRYQDEHLDIEEDGILNLINKISLRISVALVRHAKGFVGTHSSMLSAAWTNSVPSVYFYPTRDEHGNIRSVLKHGGETGSWAYREPWTHCFEMPSEKLVELDPKKVVNKLEQLIK